MAKLHPVVAWVATALLGGCAQIQSERGAGPDGILRIPLAASTYNTGKIGSATLVPQGEGTAVVLLLSGVPSYTSRPVHIYAYIHEGSCGNLSAKPAYALNDRVLARSVSRPLALAAFRGGPFEVANAAPVSLASLRATPHAIDVQTGPADGGYSIFCGDIKG